MSNDTASSFSCVSLVMIAFAKSLPLLAASPSTSPGILGDTRTIGIGSPITPVEQTPTSVFFRSSAFAASSHIDFASWIPCKPVQAFAFPEFTMTARKFPFRRFVCETLIGAAFTLFVVKTPPDVHFLSE